MIGPRSKRFTPEVLIYQLNGRNIAEVLAMSVTDQHLRAYLEAA